MEFTIKIETDNADFADNGAAATVHRILSTINWRAVIQQGGKTLMDANGNSVGRIDVTP